MTIKELYEWAIRNNIENYDSQTIDEMKDFLIEECIMNDMFVTK